MNTIASFTLPRQEHSAETTPLSTTVVICPACGWDAVDGDRRAFGEEATAELCLLVAEDHALAGLTCRESSSKPSGA